MMCQDKRIYSEEDVKYNPAISIPKNIENIVKEDFNDVMVKN